MEIIVLPKKPGLLAFVHSKNSRTWENYNEEKQV
jgi:hypothetical protein